MFRILEYKSSLPTSVVAGIVVIAIEASILFYWVNKLTIRGLSRVFH